MDMIYYVMADNPPHSERWRRRFEAAGAALVTLVLAGLFALWLFAQPSSLSRERAGHVAVSAYAACQSSGGHACLTRAREALRKRGLSVPQGDTAVVRYLQAHAKGTNSPSGRAHE